MVEILQCENYLLRIESCAIFTKLAVPSIARMETGVSGISIML